MELEREQFKKLYEDAHGLSIYLERKFASLQLDHKRDEAEAPKMASLSVKVEDDVRITNLEVLQTDFCQMGNYRLSESDNESFKTLRRQGRRNIRTFFVDHVAERRESCSSRGLFTSFSIMSIAVCL